MKHVLLKSALISFAMVAAATAWAGDSTPDAARQSTATNRAMVDRVGNPRPLRAQWVYRIVAKWAPHVQEAYRTDPRRWADSMAQVFAKASPDALKRAAEARTFAAMNDALLTPSSPAGMSAPQSASGGKALGDPDRDLVYVPVTPCRILDTRIAGGPIPANSFRDFDLTDVIRYAPQGGDTSNCNVGDKGSFAAAALNITVVTPNIAGYITAFPYLSSQPTAATLNYVAGDIRNGLAIVRLDQSAATNEFSVYSFAQTHLVADIVGYFREPESTKLECVTVSNTIVLAGGTSGELPSPACPSDYTIVGGDCYPVSASFTFLGMKTTETNHVCFVFSNSGAREVVARARCCRLPGM